MTDWQDFREFISLLEKEGELLKITEEVMPEPDVGAIARASCDLEMAGKGPAILCEKVYGYRIPLAFCIHASHRRNALALGLPKDTPLKVLFEEFSRRWDEYPVEPSWVKDGPCQEVVKMDKEVNLVEFPVVRWNSLDGGPFISKGATITRHPQTGKVNIGLYRIQLKGPNKLALSIRPDSGVGAAYREAERKGEPLPVAIAIGVDPTIHMASCCPIPNYWEEFAFAGALRGSPVEIVSGQTVDLPVPARAEVVIEGRVLPGYRELEAPFGEYTGYYSCIQERPVVEVTCVTHRRDPVFEGLYIGKPMQEADWLSRVPTSVAVYKEAKIAFPELEAVDIPHTWTASAVISIRKEYGGIGKVAMNAVWATNLGRRIKNLFVVDATDVDPFNIHEVLWALSVRFVADRDLVVIKAMRASDLDPYEDIRGLATHLGFDATEPARPEPVDPTARVVQPPPRTEFWRQKLAEKFRAALK